MTRRRCAVQVARWAASLLLARHGRSGTPLPAGPVPRLFLSSQPKTCTYGSKFYCLSETRRVATAAVTRYEKKVRFCALCGPTLRSSGLWRIPRSVHITLTSAMAVQAISARDTHHRHAQSRCSAHRIPPTRMSFCSSTARSAHRHTTKLNSRTESMMLRAAICQE